jgi:hypothetical protein
MVRPRLGKDRKIGGQDDSTVSVVGFLSSCPSGIRSNETPPSAQRSKAFLIGAGDGLLSRVLSDGVPSAL